MSQTHSHMYARTHARTHTPSHSWSFLFARPVALINLHASTPFPTQINHIQLMLEMKEKTHIRALNSSEYQSVWLSNGWNIYRKRFCYSLDDTWWLLQKGLWHVVRFRAPWHIAKKEFIIIYWFQGKNQCKHACMHASK